ncbi:uncharacterized protein LOC124295156 [Neodiprion lecontei]|uniref:Uncharacterized protein LOC124295156 n=1 Tax=Neodiprion lecontei TaxID=441921 RepID=A0ABM3GI98_NEOLC|nr:uncharacterized protein LOC124295156 [Neodiprion lecontei]
MPLALKHCKHMMYADDLQIYLHCYPDELPQAVERVNEDVAMNHDWMLKNMLSLNISKTKALIISSARYRSSIESSYVPPIQVKDEVIPYVVQAKNLGVIINNTLTWSEHVLFISRRVHNTLWQLKSNKELLPTRLRSSLVNSLILPLFDYCALVYCDLTAGLELKLKRALNSCVRFVFDVHKSEHISPYYRMLGWLDLADRRKYLLGTFLFNTMSLGSPSYISDELVFLSAIRHRFTRGDPKDLFVPLHRTTVYQRSFLVSACVLWNTLPTSIRESSSVNVFRLKLREYLASNTV